MDLTDKPNNKKQIQKEELNHFQEQSNFKEAVEVLGDSTLEDSELIKINNLGQNIIRLKTPNHEIEIHSPESLPVVYSFAVDLLTRLHDNQTNKKRDYIQ